MRQDLRERGPQRRIAAPAGLDELGEGPRTRVRDGRPPPGQHRLTQALGVGDGCVLFPWPEPRGDFTQNDPEGVDIGTIGVALLAEYLRGHVQRGADKARHAKVAGEKGCSV